MNGIPMNDSILMADFNFESCRHGLVITGVETVATVEARLNIFSWGGGGVKLKNFWNKKKGKRFSDMFSLLLELLVKYVFETIRQSNTK